MYQSVSKLERRTHGTVEDERQAHEAMQNVHIGRGGAGNFRSPSREPADRKRREMDVLQAQAQEDTLKEHGFHNQVHARGRGGVGNIETHNERGRGASLPHVGSMIRSFSRSRSREPRAALDATSPQRVLGQLPENIDETTTTRDL